MKHIGLIFFLIVFLLFPIIAQAVEFEKVSKIEGFEKILIDGSIIAYTQSSILNASQLLATDKIFYGSSSGTVKIIVYLSDQDINSGIRKYKIGLETHGLLVKITKIRVDNEAELEFINPKEGTSFIFNTVLDVSKELHKVEFTVTFDPELAGFFKKFDVVLYDRFGNELLRDDPFLSGFDQRQAINIGSTHSAIVEDYTHIVRLVDLSTLNCADNNSMAVAYQAPSPTEIDIVLEGTCGVSTDANIFFREQTLIPANTGLVASDTNGYFIYSRNTSRANPLRDCNNVFTFCDDFEDGTITGWNNISGTPFVATTAQAIEGIFSMSGGGNASHYLDQTMNIDTNAEGWFRFTANGTASGAIHGVSTNNGANFELNWRIDEGNSNKFRLFNGSTFTTCIGVNPDITVDAWFRWKFHLTASGTYDAYLFDDQGTLLCNHVGVSTDTADEFFVLADTDSGTSFMDFFKLIQGIDVHPEYTIGTLEIFNATPDININIPNLTGIQIKGGDVFIIDFNISDIDNNSLLIDLNYSSTQSQGTGTVIINDVNTDSATITCADSDFINSTNCTFSWTTPTLDANFFILAVASDGESVDAFDASDFNFMIDSTAPTFLTILPDVNFTKTAFNLDFNATIDDGVGSGNFRCITRVFFDGVLQGGLDLNVDGSTGTCIRSISSGVPNDTNVSVGFSSVDNVGNVSDENVSQLIFFSPPDVTPIVTINFPNGGETFDNRLIETIDINFTIADTDSGTWTIDINFSTQVSQGTGTPIATDLNILDGGIICTTPPSGAECIFSWDIDLVADNDYFINILVTDDQGLSAFDGSDSTFEILTTTIPSQTQDENYVRYIPPADPRQATTIIQQPDGFLDDPLVRLFGIIIVALVAIILIFAVLRGGRR